MKTLTLHLAHHSDEGRVVVVDVANDVTLRDAGDRRNRPYLPVRDIVDVRAVDELGRRWRLFPIDEAPSDA